VSFDVNDMPTPQTVQVETVVTASPFTTGPSLVVKDGVPVILFSSGNTMGDTIYMVQRTDSWSDPAYIGMGRNPVLKADNEGLYAVWENPGTGQIFYQEWPEGSLMPPAQVIASYNPDDGYAYPNVVRLRNKVMALWLGKHEGEWCLFRRSWTEEVYPQTIGDAEPVAYAGYDGYPQVVAYSVSLGGDTVLPRRYLGGGMVPQPIRSHGLRRDYFVYAYVNGEDGYLAVKKEEGSLATVGGPMSQEARGAFKGGIISLEPNPVRRVLCVRYGLKERGPVEFRVYDAAGRIVRRKILGIREPGEYVFKISLGNEFRSGIYFLRCISRGRDEVRRFLLMK